MYIDSYCPDVPARRSPDPASRMPIVAPFFGVLVVLFAIGLCELVSMIPVR